MPTPSSVHCTVNCEVNLTCFFTAAVLLQESRDQTVGPKCKMMTRLSVTKPHSSAFGVIVPSGEGYKGLEKGNIHIFICAGGQLWQERQHLSNVEHLALSFQLSLKIGYSNNKSCFMPRTRLTLFYFFKYCVSFIVKYYTFF